MTSCRNNVEWLQREMSNWPPTKSKCMYKATGIFDCENVIEKFTSKPAFVDMNAKKEAMCEELSQGPPYPATQWEMKGHDKHAPVTGLLNANALKESVCKLHKKEVAKVSQVQSQYRNWNYKPLTNYQI
jgi:hypothetical protein